MYIVAYDISETKERNKVIKVLNNYGECVDLWTGYLSIFWAQEKTWKTTAEVRFYFYLTGPIYPLENWRWDFSSCQTLVLLFLANGKLILNQPFPLYNSKSAPAVQNNLILHIWFSISSSQVEQQPFWHRPSSFSNSSSSECHASLVRDHGCVFSCFSSQEISIRPSRIVSTSQCSVRARKISCKSAANVAYRACWQCRYPR